MKPSFNSTKEPMCEPTTLTMMYISMASAAAGVVGQMQQANAQEASNAAQAKNLMESRVQNANQINLERVQAGDAAGQKLNANNMAMREAQATTIARAGPSGLSVDALLADMGRKGATYNESVTANLDRTNLQLDNQLANVNNQTTSGFNQLKTPAAPDYLGAALKIGNAYVGGHTPSISSPDTRGIDRISRGGSGGF